MRNLAISISLDKREIRVSGRLVKLTKRFFNLYSYLALARLEDQTEEGGYVECEQILQVPYWQRNTPLSVGKQIRRHVKGQGDQNVIDAVQKIKGPFRLRIPPEEIQFDVPLEEVRAFLGLGHLPSFLTAEQEQNLHQFVQHLWRGQQNFDLGNLKKALTLYRKALEKAIIPEQQATALHQIGRILERQGEYKEAENVYEQAMDCSKKAAQHRIWIKAKTYTFKAWISYRKGNSAESERFYYKALELVRDRGHYRLLGDIYNGLGELQNACGEYEQALRFYHLALEYWSIVHYFYGIQALYYNIGSVYSAWGDRAAEEGHEKVAKRWYRSAIEWTNQCMSLCEALEIAFDTTEDRILLADLHSKLGQVDEALKNAGQAKDLALGAGNKRDLALAYKVLMKVHGARGESKRIKVIFREAKKRLGEGKFLDSVAKEFNQQS